MQRPGGQSPTMGPGSPPPFHGARTVSPWVTRERAVSQPCWRPDLRLPAPRTASNPLLFTHHPVWGITVAWMRYARTGVTPNSYPPRILTWLTGLGCWALCGGRGGLIIPQKPQATGTWLKAQPHVLCLGRGWDLGEEGGAPIAPPRWPPAFPQLGGRCCGAPRRPTCLPPHTGRSRNPRLGHEFYSPPSPHPLSHPCVLLGGKPPLR